MKKLLATLLCATTMTLSVAACGSAESSSTQKDEAQPAHRVQKTHRAQMDSRLDLPITIMEIVITRLWKNT